jgi:two-component system chemotaxis sensor kinase CheA
MDYTELIRDYLDDAGSHLGVFDGALMSLEKGAFSKDLIVNALGALHTLKGNSGMMGYASLKEYVHQIEEMLKGMLDGLVRPEDVLDALFDSANVLRDSFKELEANPSTNPDLNGSLLKMKAASGGEQYMQKEAHALEPASYIGTKTDTIKVDFKRLDELLSLVGELVIMKTRLNQVGIKLRKSVSDRPLANEFKEMLEASGKMISELQEGVMKTRMVPVGHVFGKFPRMIRDLAKSQGKDVQVLLEGEDTELDKTVIDEIGEPLLHIIRNAIDHGIEPPEERAEKGKPHAGRLTLTALQESNYVVIKVSDDGRGINLERIRMKAVEKGIIGEDDPMDKENLLGLLFMPGFTTKEESTDVSGRGIGLDIVSKNISRLNGQVSIESGGEGGGSTFVLKLPLSLAIIPALMAEASGEIFAIPISAVRESVKVKDKDIHLVNNKEVVRLRGTVMPVVRLSSFFNLNGKKKSREFYFVVVGKAEKRLALAVDKLRGQQEIVIKPLDETFGGFSGIAGASILGDGRIILIVDTMSLWDKELMPSA